MKYSNKLIIFQRTTYKTGLLFVFMTLWILSIFGDYNDLDMWHNAKQIELFHWSLLFALASIIAIYGGIKYNDSATRSFGLTFLFINLYTRFFEYFWNASHKAIFFLILGISFWLLGSKAEKIWNIGKSKAIVKINS